ncbi:MAG: hypothetical protein ABEH90_05070 [Halolamina sp.]
MAVGWLLIVGMVLYAVALTAVATGRAAVEVLGSIGRTDAPSASGR